MQNNAPKKRITLKNALICVLSFIIGFVAMDKIGDPFIKELFFKQGVKKDLQELNAEMNQMSSAEELKAFFKNHSSSKDKDTKAVSVAIGFFMNGDIVRDFCMQTGYVPDKYINLRNSYKTGIDLDKNFVEIVTQKEGVSKEQAVFVLKEVKETISQQLNRILENEYLQIRQQAPSFTKADYCKIYDDHASEIISTSLNEMQNRLSDKYPKYFKE